METKKTALLGIHDGLADPLTDGFKLWGYSINLTDNPKEMLEKATEKEYDVYLMDVNLGKPNTTDIIPAIEIYNLIKSRVENKEAKFLAISGNINSISLARKQGVPAKRKSDFSLRDFLK